MISILIINVQNIYLELATDALMYTLAMRVATSSLHCMRAWAISFAIRFVHVLPQI